MTKRSPKTKQAIATVEPIEPVIRVIRGQRVILDSDLAKIYGVPTKVLNQARKRNPHRFPADFVFQLKLKETREVMRSRSQTVTSKKGRGGQRYLPYAFTEHGAVMAANVLNSERAVAMSVYVVRAFVKLREVLAGNAELASQLDALERKLTGRLETHEKAITELFAQIRRLQAAATATRAETTTDRILDSKSQSATLNQILTAHQSPGQTLHQIQTDQCHHRMHCP